jgi:hypothetical protein
MIRLRAAMLALLLSTGAAAQLPESHPVRQF